MNRQFWLVIALALILGAGALFFPQPDKSLLVPDVTLTTYGGKKYSLRELRGKVIVINFWASWCIPCKAEAPALREAWGYFDPAEVVFLGIVQGDTRENAEAFISREGIGYPNGEDRGLSKAFGVFGLPTTIIIDRDGIIRDTLLSAVDVERLKDRIRAAMQFK